MAHEQKIDILWDDNPVDISEEANFIWSIANKLRGTYNVCVVSNLHPVYRDVLFGIRFNCQPK